VWPGTPVPQDLDRFIHRGVRRRQLWPHAGIVIPNSFRPVDSHPLEPEQQHHSARSTHADRHLALFTDRVPSRWRKPRAVGVG
jgi:hypothetical protein